MSNNNYVNPTKVITGVNTRWSYANVWQPKSINGGAPKYSVSLIIPKSDKKTVEKIKTAIQAAYEEGEAKLKGNGKMDEGKALIRYFSVPCNPTKANGGRSRNLPEHDPAKWELFKTYNKRDVEVEKAIQHKLRNFPVLDMVWEEYWLDQEINDRGARWTWMSWRMPSGLMPLQRISCRSPCRSLREWKIRILRRR